MNTSVWQAHAAWYIRRFGESKPEWFVFPAEKGQSNDPTQAVTTLRKVRTKVRDRTKVVGRWHDICGEPVLISNLRTVSPEERESVNSSFQQATRHREEREPERLVARLQESFVSNAEFQTAVDNIENVRNVANNLEADRTKSETPAG